MEPLPFVRRLILVATPHRGSYLAGSGLVRRLAVRLISLPSWLARVSVDVVALRAGTGDLSLQRARPGGAPHQLPRRAGLPLPPVDAAGARPGDPSRLLGTINDLVRAPAWYNALTHNCTTTIALHAERALEAVTHPSLWNWRLLANGHLDELLYERGIIDTSRPFVEVRAASDITARAHAAGGAPDFSQQIRVGLPARLAFPQAQ